MATRWFVQRGDAERGPYEEADIVESFRAKRLSGDSQIRRETEPNAWRPLRDVVGREIALDSAQEPAPAVVSRQRSRSAFEKHDPNPYAPPPTPLAPPIAPARAAGAVVIPQVDFGEIYAFEDTRLPAICLKCGMHDGVRFESLRLPATAGRWAAFGGGVVGQVIGDAVLGRNTLIEVDAGIVLMVACGWFGWALNRRRSVIFDVPLCGHCLERWLQGTRIWLGLVAAFHLLLVIAFATHFAAAADLRFGVLIAMVVLAVAAFAVRLPRRFVATKGRKPGCVVLVNACEDALRTLVRMRKAQDAGMLGRE